MEAVYVTDRGERLSGGQVLVGGKSSKRWR
jgi:hypothetical protein